MQIAASRAFYPSEAVDLAVKQDSYAEKDQSEKSKREGFWDTSQERVRVLEGSEDFKSSGGFFDQINHFINKHAQKAYRTASVFHVLNGLTEIEEFLPSWLKTFIDKNVMRFNKIVNGLVYTNIGIQALKTKDSFDAIARFLDPIFASTSNMYNYHMYRGWSSALTLLDDANKKNLDLASQKNLWVNFISNIKESWRQAREMFKEGLSELFRKHIRSENERENNHVKSFSAHLMIIGPIIKMLFSKKEHDFGDKLSAIVRNTGGIISDIGMLRNSQADSKRAGKFYIFHAILDTAKRFFSEKTAKIIDSFIMPLYNEALYYFGVMSRGDRASVGVTAN
jgi:hypothetical protein